MYSLLLPAALSLLACTPSALPPARLCVVRHAEAYKNLSPPPPDREGEALDALTPRGEAQARALQGQLPTEVARLWSSPAQRSQQTAALLGVRAPRGVEVHADLRPLDGEIAWEMRQHAWAHGDDPRPAGGGESLADGQARVQALLREAQAAAGPGQHVVWVTHGDVASLVLGELRGTPLLERPSKDTLATGTVACLPLSAAP